MANEQDRREQRLLDRLEKVEAEIEVLSDKLVSETDWIKVVDSDVSAAGAGSVVKASQRLELLLKVRDAIQKQIGDVPFESVNQVAFGADSLGSDTGETYS